MLIDLLKLDMRPGPLFGLVLMLYVSVFVIALFQFYFLYRQSEQATANQEEHARLIAAIRSLQAEVRTLRGGERPTPSAPTDAEPSATVEG